MPTSIPAKPWTLDQTTALMKGVNDLLSWLENNEPDATFTDDEFRDHPSLNELYNSRAWQNLLSQAKNLHKRIVSLRQGIASGKCSNTKALSKQEPIIKRAEDLFTDMHLVRQAIPSDHPHMDETLRDTLRTNAQLMNELRGLTESK